MNRLLIAFCLVGLAGLADLSAEEFDLLAEATTPKIHPWQDDAALHDVQFVGRKIGWAVGDHGTVWSTEDGGENWTRIPVPIGGSLRSICFWRKEGAASNRVAWIAGRDTEPYTRVGFGIILKTEDAGKTWKQMGFRLPPLNYIRFFGTDQGIAVGEATNNFPTGVCITEDGGETWQPAAGKKTTGWHAAAFTEFHDGVVAGPRGKISLVAGSNVAHPRLDPSSLRAVRGLTMADGFSGWAVGEGALTLRTTNGAVTWEPPASSLPRGIGRFVDFQTVASVGKRVWIAGSPGSIVWHSPDEGKTWQPQRTKHRQPIHSLYFSSETHGWAVGAFGLILRTTDGGASWQAARGGDRRTAVLSIHARPDQIPFGMLSQYGGEDGYRTVVTIMPRFDSGDSFESGFELERRAQDAVTAVGGSAAQLGWRLPIALPELETSLDALAREWQKHTENQLVQVVVSNLVAQIRTWRPSIVVLDEPAPNDAATTMIQDAVKRAVREAADPTRWIEHQQLAGLGPWTTEAIFLRTRNSRTGQVSIRPYSILSKQTATVESFSERGRSRLLPTRDHRSETEFFTKLDQSEEQFQLVSQRDLLTGISIPSDSAARRATLPYDTARIEEYSRLATKQKHFRGIVESVIDQPAQASKMLAEIRDVIGDLPRPEAAMQLSQLAADYRRRSQWELAEATLIELINLYPEQPIAGEAALWLLQFWSSSEIAWQRSRHVGLTAEKSTTDRQLIQQKVQRLIEEAGQLQQDPVKLASEVSVDPLANLQRISSLPSQNSDQWKDAAATYWQSQSIQMGKVIQRRFPRAFQTEEVEWPLASVLRRSGMPAMSDAIYLRRAVSAASLLNPDAKPDGTNASARLAAGELWVARPADEQPPFLGSAIFATLRPRLDGKFDDECWRDAKEFHLTGDAEAEPLDDLVIASKPFVLLSYDDEFFYIAASLPRPPIGSTAGADYEGRTHDMDLAGFDRLSIRLDVDRDYTTAYEIEIDQRGHVAESLWGDPAWNPQMSVAIDASDSRWRLEAAIPMSDLVKTPPKQKSAWAVSMTRTMPQVGWQSWVTPVTGRPSPTQFGLVRFR